MDLHSFEGVIMPDIRCVTDSNNLDYNFYAKMYKSSDADPLTGLLTIATFRKYT